MITEMLTNSANICSKRRDYGKNILKLQIWNKEIAHALYLNKQAYKQWKQAGRPYVGCFQFLNEIQFDRYIGIRRKLYQ